MSDDPIRIVGADELEIRLNVPGEKRKCPGWHKNIMVDLAKRILICSDCGFVADAFDYVENWAKEGDRRMTALKTISIKTKIAQAELDDLMRKIVNARAVLKRSGNPQPIEERGAYENERLNAGYGPNIAIVPKEKPKGAI